jgi:hypothetical protein
MVPRQLLKGGDEYDALTRGGKRVHKWKPGERAAVRRKFNKRMRKIERALGQRQGAGLE